MSCAKAGGPVGDHVDLGAWTGVFSGAAVAQIGIGSIEELQLIGNDPDYPADGDYVLNHSIDASATVDWNGGAGFTPIVGFSGTFDGQGHVIYDIHIERGSEIGVALFRNILPGGEVKNLTILDAYISGNQMVAGMAGISEGTVTNCIVNDTKIYGAILAGGLVGFLDSGNITNSYAVTNIQATGTHAGGLVGAADDATISNCFTDGAVKAVATAGGLAGQAYDTDITQCFSQGEVEVTHSGIGGIVGYSENSDILQSYSLASLEGDTVVSGILGAAGSGSTTISESFAAGLISANNSRFGLATASTYLTVTHSFWDVDTTELDATHGPGTGLNTAAMQTQSTFADPPASWDFDAVWAIDEGSSYPYFQNAVPRKLIPDVSSWPTASDINEGASLADSSLDGGDASVSGDFVFANTGLTLPMGTHQATVLFVPNDTDTYHVLPKLTAVKVVEMQVEVTAWPTATTLTYGQTLVDITLSGGEASEPGIFRIDEPTLLLNAGTHEVGVTFHPTDEENFASVSGTVSVTINQAFPNIASWPTAPVLEYGQTLAAITLSGGEASEPGEFQFVDPTITPNAGAQMEYVDFIPTDSVNYATVTGVVAVIVSQATPEVTEWPTASDITYGETLADSTLDGGEASAPGEFQFDNPAETPNAGTQDAGVTFHPDGNNYTTVHGTVSVNVAQATPEVTTWPTASDLMYGQSLADSTLDGGEASVPGAFHFDDPAEEPEVGDHEVDVTFHPEDDENYGTIHGTVTVTVISEPANLYILSNPPLEEMKLGDQVTLIAPEGGDEYQWMKDGLYLNTDKAIEGMESQELVISVLSEEDFGEYTCSFTYHGVPFTTDPFMLEVEVPQLPVSGPVSLLLLAVGLGAGGAYRQRNRR